jgi:hypothetical protein
MCRVMNEGFRNRCDCGYDLDAPAGLSRQHLTAQLRAAQLMLVLSVVLTVVMSAGFILLAQFTGYIVVALGLIGAAVTAIGSAVRTIARCRRTLLELPELPAAKMLPK